MVEVLQEHCQSLPNCWVPKNRTRLCKRMVLWFHNSLKQTDHLGSSNHSYFANKGFKIIKNLTISIKRADDPFYIFFSIIDLNTLFLTRLLRLRISKIEGNGDTQRYEIARSLTDPSWCLKKVSANAILKMRKRVPHCYICRTLTPGLLDDHLPKLIFPKENGPTNATT